MPFTPNSTSDAATLDDHPDPASRKREPPPWECYCGLGPACPLFRQMTPQQRADCTTDKRRMAQAYYRNGLGW